MYSILILCSLGIMPYLPSVEDTFIVCDQAGIRIWSAESRTQMDVIRSSSAETTYTDARFSPDRQWISFLECRVGSDPVLRIVDTSGTSRVSFEHAFEYCWHPDTEAIAFVTGRPSEIELPCFSSGVHVHDFATGVTRQIYNMGNYVYWASFDKSLYIEDVETEPARNAKCILRFDPASGTLSESSLQGIRFCPTEEMYIQHDPFAIRKRLDHSLVSLCSDGPAQPTYTYIADSWITSYVLELFHEGRLPAAIDSNAFLVTIGSPDWSELDRQWQLIGYIGASKTLIVKPGRQAEPLFVGVDTLTRIDSNNILKAGGEDRPGSVP